MNGMVAFSFAVTAVMLIGCSWAANSHFKKSAVRWKAFLDAWLGADRS
jgi:hypothetical protein